MEDENSEIREKLSIKAIREKDEKIEKEYKRIKKLFKDLSKNKKELTEKLIKNASFMAVTLEELKEDIKQYGVKETYMNGKNQFGFKESVESKKYDVMIKNYMNIIKQLNDILPEQKKIDENDEFDKFCDEA